MAKPGELHYRLLSSVAVVAAAVMLHAGVLAALFQIKAVRTSVVDAAPLLVRLIEPEPPDRRACASNVDAEDRDEKTIDPARGHRDAGDPRQHLHHAAAVTANSRGDTDLRDANSGDVDGTDSGFSTGRNARSPGPASAGVEDDHAGRVFATANR